MLHISISRCESSKSGYKTPRRLLLLLARSELLYRGQTESPSSNYYIGVSTGSPPSNYYIGGSTCIMTFMYRVARWHNNGNETHTYRTFVKMLENSTE